MHGFQGQIKMDVQERYERDFEHIKVLFIELGAKKTPFFVEDIDYNSGLFLVKLEEVDDKETAQKLTNKPIFARKEDLSEVEDEDGWGQEGTLSRLTGFTIVDKSGDEIGVIEDIQEFPQQIMAFVVRNGKELMIPLNDAFMLDIQPEEKVIIVDLPEGLLQL